MIASPIGTDTSTTVHDLLTIGQMQSRRGDAGRKHASRLPNIAPKDEQPPSPVPTPMSLAETRRTSDLPRTRLPPRSRTGCWTCRTRKVKCDEDRPTCGQCARLQHSCDYSPRLSFRDDTTRVIERMQEVLPDGSSVWNRKLKQSDAEDDGVRSKPDDSARLRFPRDNSQRTQDDTLPPFSDLTNDDDRERKAEFQEPGTYLVVVNPDSFAALPEYSDGDSPIKSPSSARRMQLETQLKEQDEEAYTENQSDDPNIKILSKFEDCVRRIPPLVHPKTKSRSLASPTSPKVTNSLYTEGFTAFTDSQMPTFPLNSARRGGPDARLLAHYRRVISPQLSHVLPAENLPLEHRVATDAFERLADTFPPLYHAMMALSALSLAHREGASRADAIDHYGQALPSLQANLPTDQDLHSDGALFTHFFLLLYEIAAAGEESSILWSTHLGQLLKIYRGRSDTNSTERYNRIKWFVAVIDTYGLLSGSTNGDFATAVLRENLLPTGDESFNEFSTFARASNSFQSHGQPSMNPLHTRTATSSTTNSPADPASAYTQVQQLHKSILHLAIKLGLLARDFRAEDAFAQEHANSLLAAAAASGQSRRSSNTIIAPEHPQIDLFAREMPVRDLQEKLRLAWRTQVPDFIGPGWLQHPPDVPARVLAVFEHAFALHRACIIYSHTSMWSGQRASSNPDLGDEVGHCISEILQLATASLLPPRQPQTPSSPTRPFPTETTAERLERRFAAFPLFLAGFASTNHQHTAPNAGSLRHNHPYQHYPQHPFPAGIPSSNASTSSSSSNSAAVSMSGILPSNSLADTMPLGLITAGLAGISQASASGGSSSSTSAGPKQRALELINSLQHRCLGRNTKIIGDVLRAVYERQKAMVLAQGHDLHVDWRDVLAEKGLHMVNFGL